MEFWWTFDVAMCVCLFVYFLLERPMFLPHDFPHVLLSLSHSKIQSVRILIIINNKFILTFSPDFEKTIYFFIPEFNRNYIVKQIKKTFFYIKNKQHPTNVTDKMINIWKFFDWILFCFFFFFSLISLICFEFVILLLKFLMDCINC